MKSRGVTYRNGNVLVRICEDGTKYRFTPEGSVAAPEFPESIDLKITGFCEENCPMCHENADSYESSITGIDPGIHRVGNRRWKSDGAS